KIPHHPCATCPTVQEPHCHYSEPPTTEIYPLSLHDALPISRHTEVLARPHHEAINHRGRHRIEAGGRLVVEDVARPTTGLDPVRSEEHTSELQSRGHLVCRLLLEKILAVAPGDSKCSIRTER